MAKYKIAGTGVQDTETTAFIPNDEDNIDWQDYQIWVDDGNTPDPEYTEQELSNQAWADLRGERDRLLFETDFFMVYDYYNDIMTTQEKTEVTTYRTDLRELPGNTIDPNDPTWPTKPQIVIDNGI